MNPGDIAVVVCEADTAFARWIGALNDPDRGRLTLSARPGIRHSGWLARDVLAALGKRFTVAASGRSADGDWQLIPVWLAAHRIDDLVVFGINQLPPAVADDLIAYTRSLGLRLWLIADGELPQRLTDTLAGWPIQTHTPSALTDSFPHTPSLAEEEDDGWSERLEQQLPAADFPVFRAECRRLLDDRQFAVVDQRYRDAHTRTQRRLAELERLEAGALARLARELLDECVTTTEMTVALRALQAASFCAGYLVQVDLPSLLATGERIPTRAHRSHRTWKRLRCYRQPRPGAACALAAARLGLDQMTRLQLADLDEDATSVTVDGHPRRVERGADVLLRAQQLQRHAEGATDTDLLFTDSHGEPLPQRRLADAITRASLEAGVAINSHHLTPRAAQPASQLRQLGLTLHPLHSNADEEAPDAA